MPKLQIEFTIEPENPPQVKKPRILIDDEPLSLVRHVSFISHYLEDVPQISLTLTRPFRDTGMGTHIERAAKRNQELVERLKGFIRVQYIEAREKPPANTLDILTTLYDATALYRMGDPVFNEPWEGGTRLTYRPVGKVVGNVIRLPTADDPNLGVRLLLDQEPPREPPPKSAPPEAAEEKAEDESLFGDLPKEVLDGLTEDYRQAKKGLSGLAQGAAKSLRAAHSGSKDLLGVARVLETVAKKLGD